MPLLRILEKHLDRARGSSLYFSRYWMDGTPRSFLLIVNSQANEFRPFEGGFVGPLNSTFLEKYRIRQKQVSSNPIRD